MEIKELLEITLNKKASDLHLMVGSPPILRINGVLTPITGKEILSREEAQRLVFSLLMKNRKKFF